MRATYRWGRALGVVWIEDLDEGGASVTNDAERVVADLAQQGVQPDAQPIVYRDSMGRWDRLATRSGRFSSFHAIGGATLGEAISRLPACVDQAREDAVAYHRALITDRTEAAQEIARRWGLQALPPEDLARALHALAQGIAHWAEMYDFTDGATE